MLHLSRSLCRKLSSSWQHLVLSICLTAASVTPASASGATFKDAASGTPLRIYFVDVEGGQATLFVLPNHTSLLVDTGFPGNNGRDADRIMRAARLAGVDRIDYLLITHYHLDHVGGLPALMQRIPIRTFIDHGANSETKVAATVKGYADYEKVLQTGKYKHITVNVGDALPIPGADFIVVNSNDKVLAQPLPGAGRINPTCTAPDTPPSDVNFVDEPENGHSLGFLMTFGKLRILDMGDLWWPHERELMCPVNKLGHIDLLIVPHHGSQPSNSPVLIDGITPQVAIMDNGERKGGAIRVLDLYRNARVKPDLWQLHYAAAGGDEHNTDPARIANLKSSAGTPEDGHMIIVDAYANGRFKVTNERTGQSRDYTAH